MNSTGRNENGFRSNDILRRNFTVEGSMKVLARIMQHMKRVSNYGDIQVNIIQFDRLLAAIIQLLIIKQNGQMALNYSMQSIIFGISWRIIFLFCTIEKFQDIDTFACYDTEKYYIQMCNIFLKYIYGNYMESQVLLFP